jgi:hypothetical protein
MSWSSGNVLDGYVMQGRNAGPRRVNWDIPAKGDPPNRKSLVLQSNVGWAQGQQPSLVKKLTAKKISMEGNPRID